MTDIINKAHDAITRTKGKEYAPTSNEIQEWIDKNYSVLYTEEQLREAIAWGFDMCFQKQIPQDWMINQFIEQFKQKNK